jgi:two-component sensor histidine kinase
LLKPDHAQALSMALHELATNAAKYGALSQPNGVLSISWHGEAASGDYAIFWRERVPAPIGKPQRRGFGSTVIEEMLPRQISAVVNRDLTPAGLDCTIRVPALRIEDKVPLAPAAPAHIAADIRHAAD